MIYLWLTLRLIQLSDETASHLCKTIYIFFTGGGGIHYPGLDG